MLSFVDRHRPTWARLEELLSKARSLQGVAGLSAAELRELGSLYRQTASHLAIARTRTMDREIVEYLNLLMGRAHGIVHGHRASRRVRLGYFFAVEVPATFKRCHSYFIVSLSILIVFSLVAGISTSLNPGWAELFMGPGFRSVVEKFLETAEPAGSYFADSAAAMGGHAFAGYLMTHNIGVALACFAAGITFGLGTAYLLVQNSLMLGAFVGLGAFQGKLLIAGAVVVPHGIIELSAILLAGAAGLRMGYGLINPGDMLRRDALLKAAHEAVRLAAGTIPIFIAAGLIEGLLSPIDAGPLASNIARYAIGIASGVALYLYLYRGDIVFAKYFPAMQSVRDSDDLFEDIPE